MAWPPGASYRTPAQTTCSGPTFVATAGITALTATPLTRIARKITLVLFATQSLASAGFIAAAAINPILGAKLAADRSLATLPTAEIGRAHV